ncbi:MAG: DNA-3-methyladenine glycosylase [Polyangiaceae bacterium]
MPEAFFARDARIVARALLGTYLVRVDRDVVRAGRVVETEAYRGPTDAACHARFGLTKRTRTLLGAPARAYVYVIYGMYDCFNVVCLAEGRGHAVLVRAVEPVLGIDADARTDGPGRLTRALGISRAHDGADLVRGGAIYLTEAGRRPRSVGVSARVGVGYAGAHADLPLRFVDTSSAHVSRPPAKSVGRGVSVRGRG